MNIVKKCCNQGWKNSTYSLVKYIMAFKMFTHPSRRPTHTSWWADEWIFPALVTCKSSAQAVTIFKCYKVLFSCFRALATGLQSTSKFPMRATVSNQLSQCFIMIHVNKERVRFWVSSKDWSCCRHLCYSLTVDAVMRLNVLLTAISWGTLLW